MWALDGSCSAFSRGARVASHTFWLRLTIVSVLSLAFAPWSFPSASAAPLVTSWQVAQTFPGDDQISSIACPSSSDCYAVGYDRSGKGVAYATRNGGKTWVQETLPSGAYDLLAIACPSRSTCVAAGRSLSGSEATALTTQDRGKHWDLYTISSMSYIPDITCTSIHDCYGVGQTSPDSSGGVVAGMVKTTDGGSTWSSLVVPTGASGLSGVACPTSTTCYAVGNDGADIIFATTDGGSSWTTQTAPYPVGVLSGIACTSGSHCAAVGYNSTPAGTGAVISTTDGGTIWKTSALPANVYSLSSVVCPTTTACVAAGDSISGVAEIVTSGDGGTTWSDANAPGEANLSGTACSSARRCYAAGGSPSGGVIYTGRLPKSS
jgi:photosystem II stability/assembly factor-like uncharacterized protein